MITIYCGEDNVSARKLFTNAIDSYRKEQVEIISISSSFILDMYKDLADNLSLFSSKKVFCVENLEKFSFKKSTKTKKDLVYESLVTISLDKSIILLDFEDSKQARQLKLKDLAKVYESKPATSIFKLVEECFPGNKQAFISSLRTVCETQDEIFVLIMLYRHIRQVVLAAHDLPIPKLPPWQRFKIQGQAKKWNKQSLIDFYAGLIKLEILAKSSSNPYGTIKSLEILVCHYL